MFEGQRSKHSVRSSVRSTMFEPQRSKYGVQSKGFEVRCSKYSVRSTAFEVQCAKHGGTESSKHSFVRTTVVRFKMMYSKPRFEHDSFQARCGSKRGFVRSTVLFEVQQVRSTARSKYSIRTTAFEAQRSKYRFEARYCSKRGFVRSAVLFEARRTRKLWILKFRKRIKKSRCLI